MLKDSQALIGKPKSYLSQRSLITQVEMFFAEESRPEKVTNPKAETKQANLNFVASEEERFINFVGAFLVDNFWLNSKHHNVQGTISDDARMNLVVEQCADLQDKYGERMGKRLLNSSVLGALSQDSEEMVGVATLKATLLIGKDILESEKAEMVARNAVASLGPKQRREYKDASIEKIASELLPDDSKAIVVLSNLAVLGSARNQGVAKSLCEEAEALALSWGFSEIWLLVESENAAARKLYEDKLGYEVAFTKESDTALRANIETGSFEEITVDTLAMVKRNLF